MDALSDAVRCCGNAYCQSHPRAHMVLVRFEFWARDGKAVQFMNEAQIKAQEAKDFKDRQAKRAKAKVRPC